MFPVKHDSVSRTRETGGCDTRTRETGGCDTRDRATGGRDTRGAELERLGGQHGKRPPVSFEAFAATADAMVAQGTAVKDVTLARVRREIGGGNTTLGPFHRKWKEMQRNKNRMGQHQGLLSAQTLALLAEDINNHRAAAQAEMSEEMNDLREANQELEEAHRELQSIAHEQEAQLDDLRTHITQMVQAQDEQGHAAEVVQSNLSGQVQMLTGQLKMLQDELAQARETVFEARAKAGAQVSQIAALQAESKTLREASDAAKSQVAQAEQKAAVAQTQAAGKDELLQVLQGQLSEAQTRGRELTEEARRSHERARAAEETQDKLRHKLDAAHLQERGDAVAPDHERHTRMGFGSANPQQGRHRGPPKEAAPPKQSPSPAPRGHRNVETPMSARATQAAAPQAQAAPMTAYERECLIEARIGPPRRSFTRQLGKSGTYLGAELGAEADKPQAGR